MPMLQIKHTEKLTSEQDEVLHRRIGEAVEKAFHKPQSYIMLSFEHTDDLWLGGRKLEHGAFLDLRLFGTVSDDAAGAFAAAACEILKSELGIEGRNVYITYAGFEQWGHNGRIF